jgi:hypothetical protein
MASEWTVVEDERLDYRVEIPPGYELSREIEEGRGGLFHNPFGDVLAIWVVPLQGHSFRQDVAERRARDQADGWDISYQRETATWASYSGTLEDQIRYVRAIRVCDDRAAYFLIDYAREAKEGYDPIVTRMVDTFRATDRC